MRRQPPTGPVWSPEPSRGYVRKFRADDSRGGRLPIPTQIVSNEEYAPLPQTPAQAAVERRLVETADAAARRLGVDRRRFLASSAGFAAAFLALNDVFGRSFEVDAAELYEPGVRSEPAYFVLDAQTHFVDVAGDAPEADRAFYDYVVKVRGFGGMWNDALKDREIDAVELRQANFVKEIFLDSQTDVAVISGLPQMTRDSYILSPDGMARARNLVNDLAGSDRVFTQGTLSPELGERNVEAMHRQAEELRVGSWKGYPGQPLGPDGSGWWLDDEKVSYPALELARSLGLKIVSLHKGLPAPGFSAEHCHPKDVFRAALDFPDLTFLIYHAGFKGVADVFESAQQGFVESSEVPWVSELCAWRKAHPAATNVYIELGSTFGMTAITLPLLCGHLLGMALDAFGEDHVLWGTDAIWWGSPQWQIEAFKRFEMPVSLTERFGWKPLDASVKAKVLGLNAARVFGIDPEATRNPLPGDALERAREAYRESGPRPSHAQYGWVRGRSRA